MEPIRILYENQAFAVCLKPRNVLSQAGRPGEPSMIDLLKEQLGSEIYPVHRLDRQVGGVMVYAKTQASAAWFSREIQQGNLKKEYLAVVHGCPEADSGELNDLLLHDARKNKSYVVSRMRGGVKKARLSYGVLARAEDRTLVQVRLFTGRTHQIRVQFASRKLPLIGDGRYGGGSGELALWSVRLTFRYHGKALCFTEKPDSLGGFAEFPELLTME